MCVHLLYHTGQCKRTGGCYNELVVALLRTGDGLKGKKIYTCWLYDLFISLHLFYLWWHLAHRPTVTLQFMALPSNWWFNSWFGLHICRVTLEPSSVYKNHNIYAYRLYDFFISLLLFYFWWHLGTETASNIAFDGSATQLAIYIMVWPTNPTQLWRLTVAGAFFYCDCLSWGKFACLCTAAAMIS